MTVKDRDAGCMWILNCKNTHGVLDLTVSLVGIGLYPIDLFKGTLDRHLRTDEALFDIHVGGFGNFPHAVVNAFDNEIF